MDNESFKDLYKGATEVDRAAIFAQSVGQGQEVRTITFDLTTAKLPTDPYRLGFAFKSFIVLTATDSNVNVNMRLGTQDSFQDRINVSLITQTFKLPYPIPMAFFDWTAQTGKTITLIFFRTGEMSLNRVTQSASNTIMEGTAISAPTVVTLSAATAAAILPASAIRIAAIAQNETGGDIFVGNSTVTDSGATRGIRYANGERIIWKNTAALYGYSMLGGIVPTVEES